MRNMFIHVICFHYTCYKITKMDHLFIVYWPISLKILSMTVVLMVNGYFLMIRHKEITNVNILNDKINDLLVIFFIEYLKNT